MKKLARMISLMLVILMTALLFVGCGGKKESTPEVVGVLPITSAPCPISPKNPKKERLPMKTIASFTVNHDTLKEGMYISRIDGDVVTYDIRMKLPNGGDYLPTPAAHTIEHLFATYARNSGFSDQVVYVGPMGCRTGFYLLVRDSVSHENAIKLVQDSFAFIAAYEGEIPGTERWQCGNYLEHDLTEAKKSAAELCKHLEGWTVEKLSYDAPATGV